MAKKHACWRRQLSSTVLSSLSQIVVYYSNKGSNKFLAEKIARRCGAS